MKTIVTFAANDAVPTDHKDLNNFYCKVSAYHPPSKHTTSFRHPYNIHNVVDVVRMTKQRRVRTGLLFELLGSKVYTTQQTTPERNIPLSV